jgi:AraC-like DNA-binding protein
MVSIFDTSLDVGPAGSGNGFRFSSRMLGGELTDIERFRLWYELHQTEIAALEYSASDLLPFRADIDMTLLGRTSFGRTCGSLTGVERTKRNIATDGGGGHSLFINTGSAMMGGEHLGKAFDLAPDAAVMISNVDPISLAGGPENEWLCIVLPEGVLNDAFGNVDDRLADPIRGDGEVLRHLRRYCDFIENALPLPSMLMSHAADTIIDLVGLSAGLKNGAADGAEPRGLRQARLATIEQKIRLNFSEPSYAVPTIARELRLSTRYIYELLQESGTGFSERVMELRLEKARLMLSDRNSDRLRISEIAFQCGFNDISYFNRSFRRRFGCAPGSAR